MSFIIHTAGFYIEVYSIQLDLSNLQHLCRCYTVEGFRPDIYIEIEQCDIDIYLNERDNTKFSMTEIELLSLHRKLTEALLEKSVLLVHGAAISCNDKAYIISAPSGTGKSYRARQWLRSIPDSYIINGDKPYLKFEGNYVYACGSPWCGKEQFSSNKIVQLQAILFLERSNKTALNKLSFQDAFIKLLSQSFIPSEYSKMRKALQLLKHLEGKVDFYQFQSTMEPESVLTAYRIVTSKI